MNPDIDYDMQCVAVVGDLTGGVRRCEKPACNYDDIYRVTVPICRFHAERARRQFADRLVEEIATLKAEAKDHECDGTRAVAKFVDQEVDQQLVRTARWRERSLAYFIRCGPYVKIGASDSPSGRVITIRRTGGVRSPKGLDLSESKLIATEPGGFPRENELHKKFAHLRVAGEWFTETPELTEYIESLPPLAEGMVA